MRPYILPKTLLRVSTNFPQAKKPGNEKRGSRVQLYLGTASQKEVISMPVYEYECTSCGHKVEVMQRFSDPPVEECGVCHGKMKKLISQCAFHLKGTGWYVTDYGSKGNQNSGESRSKESKESKTSNSKNTNSS